MTDLSVWLSRLRAFEAEAAVFLGKTEEAVSSRAYNAYEALQNVAKLSFDQADSLKQSVRCVEAGLNQAAFVMAWTAVADLVLQLTVSRIDEVKSVRERWRFTDKASLSEEHGDFAVIEALKAAGVITKTEMKTLHGLLHRRNLCAHHTDIFPSPNEALGYIDEAILLCRRLVELLDTNN